MATVSDDTRTLTCTTTTVSVSPIQRRYLARPQVYLEIHTSAGEKTQSSVGGSERNTALWKSIAGVSSWQTWQLSSSKRAAQQSDSEKVLASCVFAVIHSKFVCALVKAFFVINLCGTVQTTGAFACLAWFSWCGNVKAAAVCWEWEHKANTGLSDHVCSM